MPNHREIFYVSNLRFSVECLNAADIVLIKLKVGLPTLVERSHQGLLVVTVGQAQAVTCINKKRS